MSPQGGGGPVKAPRALFGLGIEMAAPVVLFMYLGYRADGWLNTRPWMFLVGALLGACVGFYGFFRRVLPPKDGASGK